MEPKVMRTSLTVLFVLALHSVVLVKGIRSAQLVPIVDDDQPSIEAIFEDSDSGDVDESRFFTPTGTATATAINKLITQEQQQLEALRPKVGSSAASNVIYVNAAGTTSSTSSTSSNSNAIQALLPQIIGNAVRRRKVPNRRRRRPVGNVRSNQNGKRRRPQVYLISP